MAQSETANQQRGHGPGTEGIFSEVLVDGTYRQAKLQINSEATTPGLKNSPGLKDWVRKNGTHADLAAAWFDTKASDPDAETKRMMGELREGVRASLDERTPGLAWMGESNYSSNREQESSIREGWLESTSGRKID